jgi:hypothetical protein
MSQARQIIPLLVAFGCAPQYAYVPTTNASATVQGRLAAEYPIPPSAPQGDVRIASYGMTDVSTQSAPSEVLRALHLRVVLADSSASPWSFDIREQRVELGDHEVLAPAFASANPGTPPPIVTVDRNGKRIVDLFFLLPANLQHADAIPEFDAMWRVNAGAAGVIAERTPFERLTVEPDEGGYADWDYGGGYYWGGPYWMNADLPYEGVGVPYRYFDGGAIIRRSPHSWRGGGERGERAGGFHSGGGHVGGQGGGPGSAFR